MSAAVLLGCGDPTAPGLPAGAVPMDAPTVYAEWWRLTESCSGLTGDFYAIQWYSVPGVLSFENGIAGRWLPNGSIVLAGKHERDGPLVRHEMLHALRKRGGHQRDAFVLTSGTYEFRGAYGDKWATPAATVLITPLGARSAVVHVAYLGSATGHITSFPRI